MTMTRDFPTLTAAWNLERRYPCTGDCVLLLSNPSANDLFVCFTVTDDIPGPPPSHTHRFKPFDREWMRCRQGEIVWFAGAGAMAALTITPIPELTP